MKRKVLVWALFLLCTFVPSFGNCQTDAPADPVHRMLDEVISIQTDPKLQGESFRNERRRLIRAVIGKNFDVGIMAEEALGGHWQGLKESERSDFRKIFADLFQDSYTRLVLDFLGKENIVYNKVEIDQGRAEVKTTILRTNEEIPVDYSLASVKGEWLVRDVKIDGVSIVGNYQKTFARVIRKESYKALVDKMRLQQKAIEKSS
jgi:phospholipid transport system substrate-binding protein